jgi:hypothetical protein
MTHPQKNIDACFRYQINKTTTLRSKLLISFIFLPLIFWSFCWNDQRVRDLSSQDEAYPQSYPQIMWMDS